MAIFNSYVKLPEGTECSRWPKKSNCELVKGPIVQLIAPDESSYVTKVDPGPGKGRSEVMNCDDELLWLVQENLGVADRTSSEYPKTFPM